MRVAITIILLLAAFCLNLKAEFPLQKGELKKEKLPQPVFAENPAFIELYWKAWELAWGRVKYQEGIPQSPYMDENLWENSIWIWDTEFMVLFCRYAPDIFPGIESLNNFYETLLNKQPTSLRVWHPDNPPFYSWVESEYFKFTNDRQHLQNLMLKNKFPQRHYQWFDSLKRGTSLHFQHARIALEKRDLGYLWGNVQSGMDNTPRGRDRREELLWMDALAQQALSALYISRLAKEVGDNKTAKDYALLYKHNKKLLNTYYWDEEDGFYYDIAETDTSFVKVRTPAVYWAMLAEVADKKQAERLVKYARDPLEFGGQYPWPSVSRRDPGYKDDTGAYWRGGIWLPIAYMSTKALEKYGYYDLAYENTYKLLTQMSDTYRNYELNTIWECYSPSKAEPSYQEYPGYPVERVTPDFCGWSALGPISMFIENVIGFHSIDAKSRIVKWIKRGTTEQGIRNLRFGDIVTDIVAEGNQVEVKSNGTYTLFINNKKYKINKGTQVFTIR